MTANAAEGLTKARDALEAGRCAERWDLAKKGLINVIIEMEKGSLADIAIERAWIALERLPAPHRSAALSVTLNHPKLERVMNLRWSIESWEAGIGHEFEVLEFPSSAVLAIRALTHATGPAVAGLLELGHRVGVLDSLKQADTRRLLAESCHVAFPAPGPRLKELAEAAGQIKLKEAQSIALAASWIRYLAGGRTGDSAADSSLPPGELGVELLRHPALRGVRRSGTRARGAAYGKSLCDPHSRRSKAHGSEAEKGGVPQALQGDEGQREFLAPLVREWLRSALTYCLPRNGTADLMQRINEFLMRDTQTVRQAAGLMDRPTSTESLGLLLRSIVLLEADGSETDGTSAMMPLDRS